jgi:hypothetical protein
MWICGRSIMAVRSFIFIVSTNSLRDSQTIRRQIEVFLE